jgi:hypothetical protein
MKRKSYIIPTDLDEFIDFESTLIYLVRTYAPEWNIPSNVALKVLEKRDQFEQMFFHVIRDGRLMRPDLYEEFQLIWVKFHLLLCEFYEQYLLNNDAIIGDYKSILSINSDTYCHSKIRVNNK